jgi:hypothetical protein
MKINEVLTESQQLDEGSDDLRSAVLSVLQDIYNGAQAGEDMIDTVADELGDYFQDVKRSKDTTLRQAYQFMRQEGQEAEENPEMMAQVAKQAIDMLTQQGVAEGPLDSVGKYIGRGVGGVAKAAGAVAGGVAGIGRAFKKGYAGGKATVAGDPSPNADDSTDTATAPTAQDVNKAGPAGTPAAKPQTGAAAQAMAKTAQATAGQDAGQAGQTMYAQVKANIDKLDKKGKQRILQLLQKSLTQPSPADQKADAPVAPPAAGPGSKTAGTTATGQPKVEPDLNAPSSGGTAPTDAAAPAASAAPEAPAKSKPAAPANKAASDTFEKAKGDMRKVASGTKPLPDQMAQAVQADIAKMAKGDKESGVAAAQKIMGFAQRGMDVAALQQAWSANAKAGERFLSQSVYRSITNMLREHGMIWSDLNLRVRIDESVGSGVFIRYAKPVTEIDADRERLMGVTSDSIIRKGNLVSEGRVPFSFFKPR